MTSPRTIDRPRLIPRTAPIATANNTPAIATTIIIIVVIVILIVVVIVISIIFINDDNSNQYKTTTAIATAAVVTSATDATTTTTSKSIHSLRILLQRLLKSTTTRSRSRLQYCVGVKNVEALQATVSEGLAVWVPGSTDCS